MGDRPGYGFYLAHQYKRYNPYHLIVCKKDGEIRFFEETNKKSAVRIILTIILCLLSFSPLVLGYFLIDNNALESSWLSWIDLFVLVHIYSRFFMPLILSHRYWFSSFRSVSNDKAEEMRAAFSKTDLAKKDQTFLRIAFVLIIFIFWISMSSSGAYLRYAFDITTHNTANWPKAEARIGLDTNDADNILTTSAYIKGQLPESAAVFVRIDVTNSPYDVTVTLNGLTLLPYQEHIYRDHSLWGYEYFSQNINYEIPASLFKSVNTLHVESGYAKGDWTIEITPQQ